MQQPTWIEITNLIAALGALVAAAAGFLRVLRVEKDVAVIHAGTNSLVKQLVDTSEQAGAKRGSDEERARKDAVAAAKASGPNPS